MKGKNLPIFFPKALTIQEVAGWTAPGLGNYKFFLLLLVAMSFVGH